MKALLNVALGISLLTAFAAAQAPASEKAPEATPLPTAESDSAPAAKDASAAGDVAVSRSTLCTAVSDHEPVGAPDKEPYEFKAEVGKVFFFNEVQAKNPPATITQKWYLDDKPVGEVKLDVKYPRTRTWSTKTVGVGNWKVETVDDSGKTLATASFKVAS